MNLFIALSCTPLLYAALLFLKLANGSLPASAAVWNMFPLGDLPTKSKPKSILKFLIELSVAIGGALKDICFDNSKICCGVKSLILSNLERSELL